MSFILGRCSLQEVTDSTTISGFACRDRDLDEFFTNDCFDYARELLGKTYCYVLDEAPNNIVCAFTLANANIEVDNLPNARKKKIEANIPHIKTLNEYPAVLLGRLGVAKEFQSKHIGSEVLDFVKFWFVGTFNKAGCRFITVDAYNSPATISFYKQNGFKEAFSTDEQERAYRHLKPGTALTTRLMYYDLICKKNIGKL